MENYTPDLGYSNSDYHHVRPLTLAKTYSTCHFSQPKTKGHARQASRFTVISNVAETERSYDPFKASRPQHLDAIRPVDHAKVTIHRDPKDTQSDGVVHYPTSRPRQDSRSSASNKGSRQQMLVPPRVFASRSSLASSRSGNSAPFVRAAAGRKRGVSFLHNRKHSGSSGRKTSKDNLFTVIGSHSNHTEVTDDGSDILRAVGGTPPSTRYIRSRKAVSAVSQPLISTTKPGGASLLWNGDVRQLSTSLAKTCDDAFNRTSVVSTEDTKDHVGPARRSLSSSSQSNNKHQPLTRDKLAVASSKLKRASLNTRPLPPPPARSESVKIELLEARKQAELRKYSGGGNESPGYLDRMVSHIDCLIQPGSPDYLNAERRTLSAPVESKRVSSNRPMPPIHEARGEELSPRRGKGGDKVTDRNRHNEVSSRVASAPEPRDSNRSPLSNRYTVPSAHVQDTIRVIMPSSPQSPVRPPAPLTIRKKSSQSGQPPTMSGVPGHENDRHWNVHRPSGLGLRQQYQAGSRLDVAPDLRRIDEDNNADERFVNDSNQGTIVRKKSSWFKRNSKVGDGDFQTPTLGGSTPPSQSSSNDAFRPQLNAEVPVPPKKKGFSIGKLFKKRNSKPEMTVSGTYSQPSVLMRASYLTLFPATDIFDETASVEDSIVEAQRQSHAGRVEDPRARQIEPQRNWLAKLFHVKPVSKFICFSVGKRRARQEVATILKEWKRYGIREIQVDKERNIVFGRVTAKNCKFREHSSRTWLILFRS